MAQQGRLFDLKKELAQELPAQKQIEILTDLAYAYLTVSSESSLVYLAKADVLLAAHPSEAQEAILLNRKGLAYVNVGDLPTSLDCFRKSMALATLLNNENLVARNLGNIGLIYLTAGQHERAVEQYHKALSIFEQTNWQERIALTYSNLCHAYLEMERLDSATFYAEKSLPLAKEYAPSFYSFSLYNAGLIALAQQNYPKAGAYAAEALSYAQQFTDKQDVNNALLLKAQLDLALKNLPQAKKNAQQAVAVAESSQRIRDKMLSYTLLSKVYALLNQPALALHYYELSDFLKDSVRSTTARNALKVFEYEKKQIEVEILKAEQAKKEIELQQEIYRQKNQQHFTFGVLAGLLLLAVVSFVSFQKIKKGKKKLENAYREIHDKQEEIAAQNEEILQQNIEINHFNNHLEELVKKQTHTLLERNRQLRYYAHFNAHKLRSPIATILGLYQIMKLSNSANEKEIILEKVEESIEKLDEMVRESQKILNVTEEEVGLKELRDMQKPQKKAK